ncbi:GHKL domain-containing protein [Clostridium sp. B9]|uniref:GHKL domain-containing protein n=1 Tax=Clostridium sp. B9 TaxID=3423224 RepID=UPI003D2F3C3D
MLASNVFWDGLENISLLIEWLSFYIIIDEFSEKKNDKATILSSFLLLIIVSIILKGLNVTPNERIVICFIIGLIFYKFNFKCNNIKCIMISLMFWLFMLTIEALSISFVVKINGLSSVSELLNQNMYRLETIILSKVILISLIIVVKCLKLHIDIGKGEFIYMITPVVTNIIMILVIFGYAFSDYRGGIENNVSIFFVSIMLLLSNMSLMFIVSKIIKNNKLKLENEFIKNKLEMDYKYYSDLQVSQERVKRLYHDMKNHIVCIEESTNSEYGVRKEYLNSINKEIDKLNIGFNTGNEVLDVILNNKRELSIKNNIDFQVIMDFSKIEFIEYFDICTIFSNSLDNAIEACKKVDKEKRKFISLKGTYVKNFYIIKLENSRVNKIKYLNGEFLTDKRDKFLHGIGLKNIRSAVEKYDGEMIVETSNDKFTLKILIPIK